MHLLQCVIGTYVEWLQDPDYEPPVCSICKDEVHEDNVLRLMCLRNNLALWFIS